MKYYFINLKNTKKNKQVKPSTLLDKLAPDIL